MGDNTMTALNETFLDSKTDNLSTLTFLAELHESNRRYSQTLIPCLVYVGVLMIVGIVGNSLVCYVFGFRFKRGAQNYFIMFLAVFDILSCAVGLPGEIFDMSVHFKYTSDSLCKTMRFINTFTSIGSIFTLIVIAIDRYRRVRKPLKSQITTHHSKLSLIPTCVISIMFSVPACYVYGLRTVETGMPGVTGLDCTISDQAKVTIVPLVYNGILFLCFIILVSSLIIMYFLILIGLKKHARTIRKASVGTLSTGHENLVDHSSVNDDPTSNSANVEIGESHDKAENIVKLQEQAGDIEKPRDQAGSIGTPRNQTGDIRMSQKKNQNSQTLNTLSQTVKTGLPTLKENNQTVADRNIVTSPEPEAVCASNEKKTSLPKECLAKEEDFNDICKTVDVLDNVEMSSTLSKDEIGTAMSHVSFDVISASTIETDRLPVDKISTISDGTVTESKHNLSNTSLVNNNKLKVLHGCLNPTFQFQSSIKIKQESMKCKKKDSNKNKRDEKGRPKQRNITRKTTIIAFVVTLVFIISFVPHLCLQVAHLIYKGFDEKLQGVPLVAYNIFIRSYFINSASNPIIYGVLNDNFRAEVKHLMSRLFFCKR
uniref:G-protein coupled receptors family 1 profile domain-containing protein n=1 Tax=Arion vulgaris TaxID=1028688 RepID=A0A0B6ZZK1_9EUPU